MSAPSHVGPSAKYQAVATGGGLSPPGKIWAPPRLPVPFAVTIGIEVYPPPPGILSAPPANDTWLRRC